MSRLSIAEKVKLALSRAFIGYGIFDPEQRMLFKAEILETSLKRSQITLITVFLVQISNFIFLTSGEGTCPAIIRIGIIWMTSLCAVYAVLFYHVIRGKTSSLPLKKLVLRSFWVLLLTGTLFFSYYDLTENYNIANVTLFTLAIGIVQIMSLTETILHLIPYIAANTLIGIYTGIPVASVRHIALIIVLSIYSSQSRFLYAVNTFAERLRLSHANNILKKLSETDPLTGLLNRRGLERAMLVFRPNPGEEVGVIMMDIDFFKNYNDKFQHLAGDDCLSRIAECIKSRTDLDKDIVARFGGEEFTIIRSGRDSDEFVSFAVDLKRAVEKLRIRFDYNEESPFVTVSFGVASSPMNPAQDPGMEFILGLIEESDKQLYNAKTYGRNCVSCRNVIYR